MKSISLFQARADVAEICGNPPQVMEMPAALEHAVPSRDWLLEEFFYFWLNWKRGLGLEEGGSYKPGSGMCEWITGEFLQRLAVSARKGAPGRDINPAAFEVRVGVPPGYSLNGITDGGHSAILICTHEENTNDESEPLKRTWHIAEAQAWTLADFWTRLDVAVAGGVRVVTVID